MKIVHVINSLSSGGAEKIVCDLAVLQHKQKYDVTVIVLLQEDHVFDLELNNAGVRVVYMNSSKYSITLIIKLRKIIKSIMPEIVHSHLFPSQYYVALATLGIKIGLVTTEHNTSNSRIVNRKYKLIECFIYSRYNKVVTISDGVLNVYKKYLNFMSSRIVKIENGIDLDKFNVSYSDKNYINIDNNSFIITMVARFSPQKDQLTVIRALAILPDKVELVFIGVGSEINSSISLVKELGLERRVHFLKYRSDIAELLAISDIVVLSSFWEGFGLSAVEGMASGKPVIASNVDGLRDVVLGAGLLFEVGDVAELAQCISRLYTDLNFYTRVASACKQRSSLYSNLDMSNKYINVYHSIVNAIK